MLSACPRCPYSSLDGYIVRKSTPLSSTKACQIMDRLRTINTAGDATQKAGWKCEILLCKSLCSFDRGYCHGQNCTRLLANIRLRIDTLIANILLYLLTYLGRLDDFLQRTVISVFSYLRSCTSSRSRLDYCNAAVHAGLRKSTTSSFH